MSQYRKVVAGTIVAFYNGVRLPFELLGRPPEDWDSSGYKIHVNADYESGLRMDIPSKYIDRENYRATLGKLCSISNGGTSVSFYYTALIFFTKKVR